MLQKLFAWVALSHVPRYHRWYVIAWCWCFARHGALPTYRRQFFVAITSGSSPWFQTKDPYGDV